MPIVFNSIKISWWHQNSIVIFRKFYVKTINDIFVTYLFKRVNSAESKLGFYYFTAFFFFLFTVGLFERMYPWCYHVQSSDIAEKPTKIASDDDPEYLPDTFSTLLSLVSSAKIFQVIVEILLQCFSAQYTINTEFFIWNKVFDGKLFFLQNQALILLKKSLI